MPTPPSPVDLFPFDPLGPEWQSLRRLTPPPGYDPSQNPEYDPDQLRGVYYRLPRSEQDRLEPVVRLVDPKQNPEYDEDSPVYQAQLAEAWKQVEKSLGDLLKPLTPTLPSNLWLGGYRPTLVQWQEAQQASLRYRDWYREREIEFGQTGAMPWPYRTQPYVATVLPLYQRGWIAEPPLSPEDAAQRAVKGVMEGEWLATAMFTQADYSALFEIAPERVDIVTVQLSNLPNVEGAPDHASYHVRCQQVHKGLPVYGGQITVHTAKDDHRASLTSTFLPLPSDRDFAAQISEAQASDKALSEMKRLLADLSLPQPREFKVEARSYHESKLVILPFRGDYRLAYEVWLASDDGGVTWSLFIDAVDGQMLGLPRNLTCHARAFASSQEVLSGSPPGINQNLAANPCAAFMDITRHQANGQPTAVSFPINNAQGPRFDASNVAIHAKILHDYFLQIGADASRLHAAGARLQAVVDRPGGDLDMGFNFATRQITFQRQVGNVGLRVTLPNGTVKPVFRPAHDPELVYHEVTHGLMWQLNPDPFQNQVEAAPFARSLVEGYADYFARACAIGSQSAPPEPWAAASYRAGDWQDRWTLDRQTSKVGEDIMAAPWLYPQARTSGLAVYDAGMVWARALWDARQLLGDLAERVDQIALEAYLHATGLVTSFESVAEGLIEAAARRSDTYLADALWPLLASRGLLSEPRIQALAFLGSNRLAGMADGVRRVAANGAWVDELDLLGQPLVGVTSLVTDGQTFYAATANGVYQRQQLPGNAVAWDIYAPWPSSMRPLALTARNDGKIFAATTQGLWMIDTNAPVLAWSACNPPNGSPLTPLTGLALDVAVSPTTAAREAYYVAGLTTLQVRALTPDTGWLDIRLQDEWADLVLCVAAHDNLVFVGTATVGLWEGALGAGSTFNAAPVAGPAQFGNGAIFCLSVVAGPPLRLYVGATTGAFLGERTAAGWTWQALTGSLPPGAALTALASQGSDVMAGSTLHGLWAANGAAFSRQDLIQPLALASIPRLGPGLPVATTIPQRPGQSAPDACVLPFYLTSRSRVQIDLDNQPGQPPVLWSLESNVRQQPTTAINNTRITSNLALSPGYYGVYVRQAGAFTATFATLP